MKRREENRKEEKGDWSGGQKRREKGKVRR